MKNFISIFKKHKDLKIDEYVEDDYEYNYEESHDEKPVSKKKMFNKIKNTKKNKKYNNPKDYEYNYATISEDDYYNISKKSKYKFLKRYIIVLIILITIITMDTLLVIKFEVGPFFAIRTKVYDDGGTKQYHGLGYKVIKYNQKNGRIDTSIGLWDLEYKGKPTPLTPIELALELVNNKENTLLEITNQYIEVTSEITFTNIEEKTLVFNYINDEEKYNLSIHCNLTDKNIVLSQYNENQTLTFNGIVDNYKENKKSNNELILKNCNIKS